MTKEQYRKYFIKCKKYLKFSNILKKVGVSDANFSHFLNNADSIISISKLNSIYIETKNTLNELENVGTDNL